VKECRLRALGLSMGFRKRSDEQHAWNQWVAKVRTELINIGLPDFLWESQKRWYHFVEHGYDHLARWKPEMMTAAQRESLIRFIEREHGPRNALNFRNA